MATVAIKDANGNTISVPAPNSNGQASMANSKPVAIASDQSPIPVTYTQQSLIAGDAVIGRFKLVDGATVATIKAASTSPVPSDPALVVAISGNSAAHSVKPHINGAEVSTANPLPTSTPLAPPIVGQFKIVTTGVPVQLPSNVLHNGIVIKAKSTNTGAGFIGASDVSLVDDGTGNGYKIVAGEAMSFAVANSNSVYVNGTINDVYYFGGN